MQKMFPLDASSERKKGFELYHYTSRDSAFKIKQSGQMHGNESERGFGIYFTALAPSAAGRERIVGNNWPGKNPKCKEMQLKMQFCVRVLFRDSACVEHFDLPGRDIYAFNRAPTLVLDTNMVLEFNLIDFKITKLGEKKTPVINKPRQDGYCADEQLAVDRNQDYQKPFVMDYGHQSRIRSIQDQSWQQQYHGRPINDGQLAVQHQFPGQSGNSQQSQFHNQFSPSSVNQVPQQQQFQGQFGNQYQFHNQFRPINSNPQQQSGNQYQYKQLQFNVNISANDSHNVTYGFQSQQQQLSITNTANQAQLFIGHQSNTPSHIIDNPAWENSRYHSKSSIPPFRSNSKSLIPRKTKNNRIKKKKRKKNLNKTMILATETQSKVKQTMTHVDPKVNSVKTPVKALKEKKVVKPMLVKDDPKDLKTFNEPIVKDDATVPPRGVTIDLEEWERELKLMEATLKM